MRLSSLFAVAMVVLSAVFRPILRPAHACFISLRDAALTDWERQNATLLFLYRQKIPGEARNAQTIDQAFATYLKDVNIRHYTVGVDAEGFKLQDYELKEAPTKLPLVLLRRHDVTRQELVEVARWEGQVDEAWLRALSDSPLRQKLREALVRKYAVLLFIPGKDAEAARKKKEVVSQVVQGLRGKVQGEIELLPLDPGDEAESFLRRQLLPRETDQTAVAVVFGKGKVVKAVLVGDEIDPEALASQLSLPQQNCFCTVEPDLIGFDLVQRWPGDLDKHVILLTDKHRLQKPDK